MDRTIRKSAMLIGLNLNTIQIKATPKLDGFAGFDDGNRLYTRGDGKKVVIFPEYSSEACVF